MQLKKTHRQGRVWASKYLLMHNLSPRAKNGSLENRTPLSDEQKEAKRNTIRELSGRMKLVNTICPKCRTQEHRKLETEFVDEPLVWRIKGILVRLCDDCRY
jgi:ribosomal protein L32